MRRIGRVWYCSLVNADLIVAGGLTVTCCTGPSICIDVHINQLAFLVFCYLVLWMHFKMYSDHY